MGSSGTWVISRTGRGFLVEDSTGGGATRGVRGIWRQKGVQWKPGDIKGGLTPGERNLRGEGARNGENRSTSCEEVAP